MWSGRTGSCRGVALPRPSHSWLWGNPAAARAPQGWVCVCVFVHARRGGGLNGLLPCSVPQVEYAYSDNSLDPGECLPHRLQLWRDTPISAL